MKFFFNIIYLFRKYPLFRVFSFFFITISLFALFFFITKPNLALPVIYDLDPPVGTSGEILTISGTGFGDTRGDSYVEIGGSRITISSYIDWKDSFIKVVLPQVVPEGLVTVTTVAGKSEPKIFANKATVPVVVPPDLQTTTPQIISIDKTSGSVGQMITIYGNNFGGLRDSSSVSFGVIQDTVASNQMIQSNSSEDRILCSDTDFDYEFWSDEEIRVRIPDGATSGFIVVETAKGKSNQIRFSVLNVVGKKVFTDKRTYSINVSLDITEAVMDDDSTLTLRVPYPPTSTMQRWVEMNSCVPPPVVSDYLNTVVHQLALPKTVDDKQNKPFEKKEFSHSFLITTYGVETSIQPNAVVPFSEKSRLIYTANTRADDCIKSDDEKIIELAKQIIGKEKNPYLQAQLIYNYMLDNYTILPVLSNEEKSNSLMSDSIGDAYDFTVLYTTLIRSIGIPSVPIAGILIDSTMKSVPHWWCEFYIENFGWVPVDIALGAGYQYASFKEHKNPRSYYFGNLDGQHIAFSRGWNSVKPALVNSKTVYRPKTYAFQSIWEEATSNIIRYSSFWGDPFVTGIY